MSLEHHTESEPFSLASITELQRSIPIDGRYRRLFSKLEDNYYDAEGNPVPGHCTSLDMLAVSEVRDRLTYLDGQYLFQDSRSLRRGGTQDGEPDDAAARRIFSSEYGQELLEKYQREKIDTYCIARISSEIMHADSGPTLADLKSDADAFENYVTNKKQAYALEIQAQVAVPIQKLLERDPLTLWNRIQWADEVIVSRLPADAPEAEYNRALIQKYNERTKDRMRRFGYELSDEDKDPITGLYLNPMMKQDPNLVLPYGRGVLGEYGLKEAVDLVIEDEDGNQLMFDRPRGEGRAYPGGMVDAGETPQEAALRELREEIGIDLPGVQIAQCGSFLVADSRNTAVAWVGTHVMKVTITRAQRAQIERVLVTTKEAINPHFASREERKEHPYFASHQKIDDVVRSV